MNIIDQIVDTIRGYVHKHEHKPSKLYLWKGEFDALTFIGKPGEVCFSGYPSFRFYGGNAFGLELREVDKQNHLEVE